MFQHPVHSRLTPQPSPLIDQSYSRQRFDLEQALPSPLIFENLDWSVLLYVSTGRVAHWLTMDGGKMVLSSNKQVTNSIAQDEPARESVSPSLLFLNGKKLQARYPLIVNSPYLLPLSGDHTGTCIEIIILGFKFAAQSMRGPEAGASWIDIAWRRINKGTDMFVAPIARRKLRQRLQITRQPERVNQAVEAEYQSRDPEADFGGIRRGGLNWRLTHD